MQERTALITVEHLKKNYHLKKGIFSDKSNYVKAVDDVSIVLPRYRTVGLVGESGCGKSTLGKTILRLIPPSAGKVCFEDKILFDVENKVYMPAKEMNRLRREMAVIFQDPYSSLNPHYTIGQAVQEGVVYHRIVSKEEAAEYCIELLENCGLERDAYYRHPVEFSGGQRQRAVIARALALKPKFVVCDEPTAALDVSIQSQILNLMLNMREKYNLTYLFISHNLGVTRAFCDDIAVMYLGKIIEYGPAEEIYSHGLHPYTRALIASLPVTRPGMQKKKVEMLDSIPSMLNVPGGCRFHPRCPYATSKCKVETPDLRECAPDHKVACHLAE